MKSEYELYEEYDEWLNETLPSWEGYLPSQLLKEVDPVRYNVGFTDWLSEQEEEDEDEEGD